MVRTFHNVRLVPNVRANIISLGEMTRSKHRYVGSGRWCKMYRGNCLVLQGKKIYKNICYLDGYAIRSRKIETVKKAL